MTSITDINITTGSHQQTFNLGLLIARKLRGGDIICLFGELGSGKTVLIKGIAKGLNLSESEVNSPSFVLLKQYQNNKITLNHFDLFRLKKEEEILGLGFEDYVYSDNISAVEWADRLGSCLPGEFLGIKLAIAGKAKRRLKLFAKGNRYNGLLKELRLLKV